MFVLVWKINSNNPGNLFLNYSRPIQYGKKYSKKILKNG